MMESPRWFSVKQMWFNGIPDFVQGQPQNDEISKRNDWNISLEQNFIFIHFLSMFLFVCNAQRLFMNNQRKMA